MYAITGASGFIGNHLEDLLKEKKINYIKIGRKKDSDFIIKDINSKTNWSEYLDKTAPPFCLVSKKIQQILIKSRSSVKSKH